MTQSDQSNSEQFVAVCEKEIGALKHLLWWITHGLAVNSHSSATLCPLRFAHSVMWTRRVHRSVRINSKKVGAVVKIHSSKFWKFCTILETYEFFFKFGNVHVLQIFLKYTSPIKVTFHNTVNTWGVAIFKRIVFTRNPKFNGTCTYSEIIISSVGTQYSAEPWQLYLCGTISNENYSKMCTLGNHLSRFVPN